ncbi:MAG: hypothetical protein WEA31_07560 [Pirellulales bacterium]
MKTVDMDSAKVGLQVPEFVLIQSTQHRTGAPVLQEQAGLPSARNGDQC